MVDFDKLSPFMKNAGKKTLQTRPLFEKCDRILESVAVLFFISIFGMTLKKAGASFTKYFTEI